MTRPFGFSIYLAGLTALLLVASCTDRESDEPSKSKTSTAQDPRAGAPVGGLPVVEIEIRELGTLRVELFPHEAPLTVANFLKLGREDFYRGTTFHRVIPGFMIQGGDPLSKDRDPRNDGYGDPGYTIPDEPNDVSHRRGVIAMANKGYANTGGSQFFILLADRPELDGTYTVFGEVVGGMDVVDTIAAVETDRVGRHGPRDRPLHDRVIESVRLLEAAR